MSGLLASLPAPKFVRALRDRARQFTCGSVLYNWSLGGALPEAMAQLPTDVWPGDAEAGRWLCDALADFDDVWTDDLQGFAMLRDLRAVGGDAARRGARMLIERWIERHKSWSAEAWEPGLTGKRIANWLALYSFYGASADEEFQARVADSLARQARHLARALPGQATGLGRLRAIAGLALTGLAFPGRETWLEHALDALQLETERQILPDGGHVSRSAAALLEALQIFTDIRAGLAAAGYPVPEHLEHTIDRMAQGLRFFRAPDKHFTLFNGAQEGDEALIDAALQRVSAGGRILRHLPQTGYERVTLGRSLLMIDTGSPPPRSYDTNAHAAPLAFEFMYGKERLLVSCGSHPSDPAWRDALRGTAAHNTLTIDNRNACEIREEGHFSRKPASVKMSRDETKDAVLLDGSHDGYVALNGVTHRRRLYLTDQGHDLRGEDRLICATGLSRPLDLALRFHLHPGVQAVLIQQGQEALLRLPGGAGWRFSHAGGQLALEDSIYLGSGSLARKTKQLVIYGSMSADYSLIKWAVQREGR